MAASDRRVRLALPAHALQPAVPDSRAARRSLLPRLGGAGAHFRGARRALARGGGSARRLPLDDIRPHARPDRVRERRAHGKRDPRRRPSVAGLSGA